MKLSNWPLPPPKIQLFDFFLQSFSTKNFKFKCFGICTEKKRFRRKIDDMAKAAKASFFQLQIRSNSLQNSSHANVIRISVVQDEISKPRLDFVVTNHSNHLLSDIFIRVAPLYTAEPKECYFH